MAVSRSSSSEEWRSLFVCSGSLRLVEEVDVGGEVHLLLLPLLPPVQQQQVTTCCKGRSVSTVKKDNQMSSWTNMQLHENKPGTFIQ